MWNNIKFDRVIAWIFLSYEEKHANKGSWAEVQVMSQSESDLLCEHLSLNPQHLMRGSCGGTHLYPQH